MKVMLSGATGFIGYHTAAQLRSEGHEVRALVRSAEKAERVLRPLGVASADLVVGDMRDVASVQRAMAGCDAAVHAAADVGVTGARRDFSANLVGTRNVVGVAREREIHTVFVSSLTAIFDPRTRVDDDSPLVRSRTHYGRSKTECDAWVRDAQEASAPIAILYPPGVVGPDDPGFSESVRAYRNFLRGTLASEGGNLMADARDLAQLIVRMTETRAQGRIVAGGHFFDWDEFTALLEEVTGARIPRIRAPGWLLRAVARSLDVVGAATGRTMPMSGEGVEIATRFRPVPDSPRIAELGVAWRPPEETIRDLFVWLRESGRLPAKALPSLVS